jgi:ParB family transcriptional regulator, chromosome partitioning protein
MAKKQSDYLAALLADEGEANDAGPVEVKSMSPHTPDSGDAPSPIADPVPSQPHRAGMSLLSRESALARVASGEVRQVTQLLLDPARVRIWPGNARVYANLTEAGCRELIDSILAEGGQKVPAVVRRVEGDPFYDYEVIAGTRRHWSISWLRANHYPDMVFVAQVQSLDDESAFRLADLENRARKDVSDLERARNYAAALASHYGGHQTRMADRLKISKGWLSKMLKVATIPTNVAAAFASTEDLALTAAYLLATAMDDPVAARRIAAMASLIEGEQAARRAAGQAPFPTPDVLQRLLDGAKDQPESAAPLVYATPAGRPMLSLLSQNRQGVTVRLHAASGADKGMLANALHNLIDDLGRAGRGLS